MMDESILSCHHSCHCSSYHGSGDHHHMIINDYHCSDDHHHHMIKDILHCNFALELFSIVVSRKSRTDCSQMFFQLRARRSVSAGSQIPITIITFYALWPTILISNVCLKNIYPIFQKWMERWVCVRGKSIEYLKGASHKLYTSVLTARGKFTLNWSQWK